MKHACIAEQLRQQTTYPALTERFDVRLMCRVLGVSPSGFYAAQRRGPSARAQRNVALAAAVKDTFVAMRRRYGAPRVHDELQARGERVAKKRVARLMREQGLRARPRRRFVRTTESRHAETVVPNHLARPFAVPDVPACDRVWVSDITYVPTRAGWLYLAVVLDLASRRVVGWAMRETLEEDLTLAALRMALVRRQPGPGLVHHSDRGIHYASRAYRARLAAHGAVASMSRAGNCWDNAVAESFFATLEHELIAIETWRTRDEARRALFEFIEVWYNRQRRHSSLGYLSPVSYEEWLRRRPSAA